MKSFLNVKSGGELRLCYEIRGLRNNNCGNIRHGSAWNGLCVRQNDKDFCQFISPEYGIRALSKLLDTYHNKYNLHTVGQIISRYAPSSENHTQSYIKFVLKRFNGMTETCPLFFPQDKLNLIKSIIEFENGMNPYGEMLVRNSMNMG